jgi:arsenate reductase
MNLFQSLRERRGRVLFVCLGNSCRSQMAEAFANAYGNDVIEAHSAGIQPASRVSSRTRAVMAEKRIPIGRDQAPKAVSTFDMSSFDLIINLSEYGVPKTDTRVLKLPVPDPIGHEDEMHREARDKIEAFVRFLVEHFRAAKEWGAVNPLYSEECALASSR